MKSAGMSEEEARAPKGKDFVISSIGSHSPPSSTREQGEGKNHFQTDCMLEAFVTYFICPFCKQKTFFRYVTASCTSI